MYRFRFDLAEALGKFPHEIDEMPIEDFQAFYIKSKKSPLVSERLDFHHSLVMWQLARVNSASKDFKHTPSDYMPFKPPKKPPTPEELEAKISASLKRVENVIR